MVSVSNVRSVLIDFFLPNSELPERDQCRLLSSRCQFDFPSTCWIISGGMSLSVWMVNTPIECSKWCRFCRPLPEFFDWESGFRNGRTKSRELFPVWFRFSGSNFRHGFIYRKSERNRQPGFVDNAVSQLVCPFVAANKTIHSWNVEVMPRRLRLFRTQERKRQSHRLLPGKFAVPIHVSANNRITA